jgi:uncharacterized membrane protein HdeD (DUF308 family)
MASMPAEYDVVTADDVDPFYDMSNVWWLWLILGVLWIGASFVILQFDQASITTVGIITGTMFIVLAMQQLILALIATSLRWLWAIFGVVFLAAGIICLVNPEDTFHGMADILGGLFMTVGVWWAVRAFVDRATDSLWWVGLVGAVLMLIMAFWTSGQFYIDKAYTLLVFAGIWALMQGITDIIRAFQLRALRNAH